MEIFGNTINQLELSLAVMKINLPFVLKIIAALYGIQFLNFVVGYRLNLLGIYPRRLLGLPGIFISPFLHGSFSHLFFNSLPLFFLLNFILLGGMISFYSVSATIITLGGLATWLFGRSAIHVGASGLILGYWAYLLVNAYQEGSATSIALGIICIYYFGGLALNLFPRDPGSSWEAHIFGFLAGIAANYTTPYLTAIFHVYGYY